VWCRRSLKLALRGVGDGFIECLVGSVGNGFGGVGVNGVVLE
jgi:hypothetical protein